MEELISFSAPLCLSGGAAGADMQFGMVAGSAGDTVIHWSFDKGRTDAPDCEVVRLTQDQLIEADPFLERANATLGRQLPKHRHFIISLLRRNYYQVKDSASCYAVAEIKGGMVQGGTAWATQMFIDQHEGKSCPCYVFDQIRNRWVVWQHDPHEVVVADDPLIASWEGHKGHWEPIEQPPRPSGIYAGIGTRKLSVSGKAAIRALYGYTAPVQP